MRNKARIDSINLDGRTGQLTMLNGPKKNSQLDFDIPFMAELGMAVDTIIRVILIENETKAVSAVLPGRGDIKTINLDGTTGKVFDKSVNAEIDFDQPGLADLGIVQDSIVRYDRVKNSSGATVAVSLTLVE